MRELEGWVRGIMLLSDIACWLNMADGILRSRFKKQQRRADVIARALL